MIAGYIGSHNGSFIIQIAGQIGSMYTGSFGAIAVDIIPFSRPEALPGDDGIAVGIGDDRGRIIPAERWGDTRARVTDTGFVSHPGIGLQGFDKYPSLAAAGRRIIIVFPIGPVDPGYYQVAVIGYCDIRLNGHAGIPADAGQAVAIHIAGRLIAHFVPVPAVPAADIDFVIPLGFLAGPDHDRLALIIHGNGRIKGFGQVIADAAGGNIVHSEITDFRIYQFTPGLHDLLGRAYLNLFIAIAEFFDNDFLLFGINGGIGNIDIACAGDGNAGIGIG
ncbi:MAG: hypothetical protein BWY71_01843 [Planctomycetes bacterium ADurb.Bin412]|nr:MAG: hypothetical protein BWY71_01843 [Planctomycetes bacterium ADurb.Bin412]